MEYSQYLTEKRDLQDELVDLIEADETLLERQEEGTLQGKSKASTPNLNRIAEIRARLERIEFDCITDPSDKVDFRAEARVNGTFDKLFPEEVNNEPKTDSE